ncbi:MAG: methyltransferase domain-containing protein [Rhizobiales bacterium]|nr:methyltransferase domain-containing protein [Hyphomicrobiales bacterium]
MTSPVIFDRRLLRDRRIRAAALGPATFLLERVAADMAERLEAVLRRFPRAIDLCTPTDAVRRILASSKKINDLIAIDTIAAHLPRAPALAVAAEEEALPFRDGTLDLVLSALALQFVNDLPGALVQIRRALKPDGLLLAAVLGGDSLTELRQSFAAAESEVAGGVSPRVAPFVDVRSVGMLLQRAGFALPVTDVDRVVVRYETPFALMHDLRRMGATNVLLERRRAPASRKLLMRAVEHYFKRFSDDDGRIRATFEVVWMSAWAPDPSQPKPLKPGSAKHRLADALGVKEFPTGEKPGG